MNNYLVLCVAFLTAVTQAATYTDATGDIDPGIATGNGTLDIVSMEVTHTASDLILALTVNGNVATTDWGKFCIGMATLQTLGTTTGNGWARPINLVTNVGATPYGMNYWIGTWVDGGGGAQLWAYDTNTAAWTGPTALTAYSFTPGVQSIISCTVARSAVDMAGSGSFAFDAYSSGGGGGDSAVDALANPNVSITAWGGPYTSQAPYLDTYLIPEPATLGLLGVGALVGLRLTRRTR